MRRPVKPFVTEYKSSGRRPKDLFESPPPGAGSLDNMVDPGAEPSRGWAQAADDNYEAALRAADALFSSSARRTDANNDPPSDTPVGATRPAEHHGGRVLQAIEDKPDALAIMEADRAPSRRGRKPGSKNKPKMAAIVDLPAAVPAHFQHASPAPEVHPASQVAGATQVDGPNHSRRGERFAWVRTSLRPGEKWKRRLPKVAW